MNIDKEIELLKQEIKRLGTKNDKQLYTVKFGIIVMDDVCSNLFEALVGTLRAAKKRKIIHFEGEMLLKGAHDNVDIVLLQE